MYLKKLRRKYQGFLHLAIGQTVVDPDIQMFGCRAHHDFELLKELSPDPCILEDPHQNLHVSAVDI